MFRVRAGPDTRPDYGIVQGHAQACTVTQPAAGTWALALLSNRPPLRTRAVALVLLGSAILVRADAVCQHIARPRVRR